MKVWTYAKKADKAIAQAPKNAVHGIIFKGYAANPEARVPGRRAMVTDYAVEQEFADYFEEFFADGGRYMRFVSLGEQWGSYGRRCNKSGQGVQDGHYSDGEDRRVAQGIGVGRSIEIIK